MNFFKKIIDIVSKEDKELLDEKEIEESSFLEVDENPEEEIKKETNSENSNENQEEKEQANTENNARNESDEDSENDEEKYTELQPETVSGEELRKALNENIYIPSEDEFFNKKEDNQNNNTKKVEEESKDKLDDDFTNNFFSSDIDEDEIPPNKLEEFETKSINEINIEDLNDSFNEKDDTEIEEEINFNEDQTDQNKEEYLDINENKEPEIKKEIKPIRTIFSVKEKVKEEYRENLLKRFGIETNDRSSSSESKYKPTVMTTKKEEELIKERLYGDHLIKKTEQKEEIKKEFFGDETKQILRVDLEKVNAFLQREKEKIYTFIEEKINHCYKNISKEVNILQETLKLIGESSGTQNLADLRDKTKLITELTLIFNKFITPKTRGLKRVKLYQESIETAIKEYHTLLSRFDISIYITQIEIITKSIDKIKGNSLILYDVISLEKIEKIQEIESQLEELFMRMNLKNKITKEIERRKSALKKFMDYKSNMNKENIKLLSSDGFKKFKEIKSNKESIIKELKTINTKICEGFETVKEELFQNADMVVLSPIIKLYLKNCSETIKNDLNKELSNYIKKYIEMNSGSDNIKFISVMRLLNEHHEKNEELKGLRIQINNNAIMQDQLDLDYKQSHILEKEAKIKEELIKLEEAYKKIDITYEKAKLTKEMSFTFDVNFLIN